MKDSVAGSLTAVPPRILHQSPHRADRKPAWRGGGMAHVEKRGPGRWRARYRAPDGRERSKTFDRRIDAERCLTSIEHSKLVGNYVDPAAGRITFKCFAETWRTIQVHRSGTAQSVEG